MYMSLITFFIGIVFVCLIVGYHISGVLDCPELFHPHKSIIYIILINSLDAFYVFSEMSSVVSALHGFTGFHFVLAFTPTRHNISTTYLTLALTGPVKV